MALAPSATKLTVSALLKAGSAQVCVCVCVCVVCVVCCLCCLCVVCCVVCCVCFVCYVCFVLCVVRVAGCELCQIFLAINTLLFQDDVVQKFQKLAKDNKTLHKPASKEETQKATRAVAYDEASKEVSKWVSAKKKTLCECVYV